jgi:hypothetical protein
MSNYFDLSVPYVAKALANMERWIDKTEELAKAKKFDANTLLTSRLAPDMLPLVRQVQMACDNAKFICFRGAGKDAPAHPDTEQTWAELRTRIRSVRELVGGFKATDFDGLEGRTVSLSWMPGKALSGKDYVFAFALPNFDFHLAMTYALLRHAGVDVGKQDYIGSLPFRDVP